MYIFIESLKLAALLLCVSGITCIINAVMKKRNFKVKSFVIYPIMGFISVLLFILGGLSVWTVKGIVLSRIMLLA